ncbi:hypothetical protein K505DRAFT_420327 [Melanomma pulvis-pyrius CBS 109.77]|uniref:Uncharacterized protein n=1 Tax=Melanomma pulvis-pyrius CBS 109.77 TaxID=1314802 RepID=A0A6A6X0F1_9PLEO|nr:hypothetical protein K505DRAFT_420327 [Melanomma pulvis-pyrius CBS 109.77]
MKIAMPRRAHHARRAPHTASAASPADVRAVIAVHLLQDTPACHHNRIPIRMCTARTQACKSSSTSTAPGHSTARSYGKYGQPIIYFSPPRPHSPASMHFSAARPRPAWPSTSNAARRCAIVQFRQPTEQDACRRVYCHRQPLTIAATRLLLPASVTESFSTGRARQTCRGTCGHVVMPDDEGDVRSEASVASLISCRG